jgi:hypothetical protein
LRRRSLRLSNTVREAPSMEEDRPTCRGGDDERVVREF